MTIITRKSSCGKPQEAYRQRHNLFKHNLSPEGGYPILSWLGVPHPVLIGGGYPILSWLGGYPILSWLGVPHLDLARWVPHPDLAGGYPPGLGYLLPGTGVPPERTWDHGSIMDKMWYPQKGYGTSGSIVGWRWGTPRVWTDKQTEHITSRCTSYAGGKNVSIAMIVFADRSAVLRNQVIYQICYLPRCTNTDW